MFRKNPGESFFMVMNFVIANFMALVQGHKFSMNYKDLSFTQPMKKVHGHLRVGHLRVRLG